jgi:predicted PurR-regulated permease PerM
MWGFLIGLYLAMIMYPFLEEWQQGQADKRRLAKMREQHARGRRWDATKGESIDE